MKTLNGPQARHQGLSPWQAPLIGCVCPGRPEQAGRVRAGLRDFLDRCPVRDDVTLLVSELAVNACVHSDSGLPGGSFAVLVADFRHHYVYAEIRDQGSAWDADLVRDASSPHGLYLLQSLATTYGAAGGRLGWIVWFTVAYPASEAA